MSRSWSSVKRAKMYTPTVLLLCGIFGNSLAYYVQREAPYYNGPNDPYPIVNNYNIPQEQSQRLFWSNGQGSNQVGGTGLWATLTNKFPFLGNMFGRMELPSEYGVPNQFNSPTQYNAQGSYQAQYQPGFRQQMPFGRDVAITDDAVIVTPPQVPIGSQPVPAPAAPAPHPQPHPQPSPAYHYDKPQNRLELPQKYY